METKTIKAVALLKKGNLREALSIFRKFRCGFTREQIRSMEIAYESLSGHAAFYNSIGIDTAHEIAKSKSLLEEKYT